MAFPITLSIDLSDFDGDGIADATLWFLLPTALQDTVAHKSYPPLPQRVTLVDGVGSIVLLATKNDADITPTGLYYIVTELIGKAYKRTYHIELDKNLGANQNLADLPPLAESEVTTYYETPLALVNSHIAATTNVHGIVDSSELVALTDLDLQGIIVKGNLTVATNVQPPGLLVTTATTILLLAARVGTAPTGAAVLVTFKADGVSLGTVTIAAGATSGQTVVNKALTEGQILTWDVTQIGSTIAGADLWVRMTSF